MTNLQSSGQDRENVREPPVVYHLLPMGGRVLQAAQKWGLHNGYVDIWPNAESKVFFSRGIFLCLYREPQPQKTQKAPLHRPKTPSTENPNPEKRKPNLRPKHQNPPTHTPKKRKIFKIKY